MAFKKILSKVFQSTILSLFLISHSCGSFILKNDEVIQTHKNMSTYLKDRYQTLPEYFDKSNNLCTASIQFLYKEGNNDNILVTQPEYINRYNKPIISASAYTQDIYKENSTEISEILSWPFKDTGILRRKEDKNNFQKGNPTKIYNKLFTNNNHEKCYKALDISWNEYKSLLDNLNQITNPVFYLKNNYDDYQNTEFEDMKHSEPLLIKWIELHINDLKEEARKKILANFMDEVDIEILYPVIHFHTRRQTCSDCENLIQKSAKKFRYVPIISFSDLYLSQKQGENCDPCSLQLTGGEKYFLPFSKLKNTFLDFDTLKKIRRFIKPRVKDYYLQKKYPLYSTIINKEFEDRTLNELKVCENYRQEKERLKGIKRFPIQFYAPF